MSSAHISAAASATKHKSPRSKQRPLLTVLSFNSCDQRYQGRQLMAAPRNAKHSGIRAISVHWTADTLIFFRLIICFKCFMNLTELLFFSTSSMWWPFCDYFQRPEHLPSPHRVHGEQWHILPIPVGTDCADLPVLQSSGSPWGP